MELVTNIIKGIINSLLFLFAISSSLTAQDLLKLTTVDSISIFYNTGGYLIDNKSQLVKTLNSLNIGETDRIKLVAYTDTVGTIKVNTALASKRLSEVAKLIKSTNLKTASIDSVNMNEMRKQRVKYDSLYRRVDIIVYKVEPSFTYNTPINLQINFESGTDMVLANSAESLKKLKIIMDMKPSLTIKVHGHVCCESDYALSVKRAQRVKTYLVSKGIDGNRITCQGFDNKQKLAVETSEATRALNRRVEVIFIEPK